MTQTNAEVIELINLALTDDEAEEMDDYCRNCSRYQHYDNMQDFEFDRDC